MLTAAAMAVGLFVGALTMSVYNQHPPTRQTQGSGSTQMASMQTAPPSTAPTRYRLPPP